MAYKLANSQLNPAFELIESEWAERSEFWLFQAKNAEKKLKRRNRNTKPLILCGHGISMRVEAGTLVIRDGFTHYPQKQTQLRFFRGDLSLPPRILLLDGSGTLSFDVLSWLGEQNVALARVNWKGEVAIVASGSGYAADQQKILWQMRTRNQVKDRMNWSKDLIRQKLINSVTTLKDNLQPSPATDVAIQKAQIGVGRLSREKFTEMNDIRAIEGECAAAYFSAWKGMEVNWKENNRHPIPDEWRKYGFRSAITKGKRPSNRNASHPVNAMLNYAYAIELAQLQIRAIAGGYDPTIGIMHHESSGTPAFIFDLIEPERPNIDATILKLIKSHSFSGADFVIRADGECRLSPQLARTVVTLVNKHRASGSIMNGMQVKIIEQKRKYRQLNAAHKS